jgi:RNA polymerase sigma-70 factor (ECF subfamily)
VAAHSQHEEEELIRRFKAGDEAAFRLLLEGSENALYARVEGLMPRGLKRRISVADVLQEARMIAFENRHDLIHRGPGSFRKWLSGIVEKKFYHAMQRHVGAAKRDVGREVSRKFRRDTAAYTGKATSPSQAAIGSELAELALQAMAELPDDHREVLQMGYVEHLDLEDIAKRMGRSREAVRKLYGRALLAFTEKFKSLRGRDHG